MTDFTSNPPSRSRQGRQRSAEFYIYFTLIFLLAIPAAWYRWARDVFRHGTLNIRGPMARAWSEADRITPLIFSI